MPRANQTLLMLIGALCAAVALCAAPRALASSVQENRAQVQEWNRFADRLVAIHRLRLRRHEVRSEETIGGYAGLPKFYREVSYFDARTDRPLSRVRREISQPDTIHGIEIYFYDDRGRLEREYSASYLPEYRNAPIQTLVNIYGYNGELNSLRQFDASGARIFEHCRGTWFDEKILIALDEPLVATPDTLLESEAYFACFGRMPVTAGDYLDLAVGQREVTTASGGRSRSEQSVEARIATLTLKSRFAPRDAQLYVDR